MVLVGVTRGRQSRKKRDKDEERTVGWVRVAYPLTHIETGDGKRRRRKEKKGRGLCGVAGPPVK